MTAEEQAAAAARYEADATFLRAAGAALEAEAKRRREAGEPAMTAADAAAIVATL